MIILVIVLGKLYRLQIEFGLKPARLKDFAELLRETGILQSLLGGSHPSSYLKIVKSFDKR